MRTVTLITFIAFFASHVHGATVYLHDASQKYLQGSLPQEPYSVSQHAAAAALAAASGLVPPYNMDPGDVEQVQAIVQHDVFEKPSAVVLLHIAGHNTGANSIEKLTKSLGDGHTVQLNVHDDDNAASAGSVLQATSDLIGMNPEAAVTVLDHSALKGCKPGTCMVGHLSTAAHHCGGKLHQHSHQASSNGLTGLLELPGLSNSLDLSHPSARLFGIELAGLQGSLQQEIQRIKEASIEAGHGPTVYESTFVGLQGLSTLYPKGSAELEAAENALMTLLGRLAADMREVYGDRVLYQIALLGDAPVSSGAATHLMSWKEVSRRALLQRTAGRTLLGFADDDKALGKKFAGKATAYAVALILIWFTFAGVYCMVSMRFKQDTLLYGRSKAD